LNDRTGAMTGETLQRVQDAISTLDYHPNMAARGLVSRYSATVGVILTEIETPLFLQALPGMEAIARAERYNLLLCLAASREEEQDAVGLLIEKRVDGVIFFSSSEYRDDAHLQKLCGLRVPLVLVNRSNQHDEIDSINWDQMHGVSQVVHYLVERGHERIAHLTGPLARKSTADRLAGYRQGLRECGLADL
jgi:DNA-binding LacI/PurR family transcriptional regulator